jgi:hypothetical protein
MATLTLILQSAISYVIAPLSLIIILILAVIKWRESRNNPYNIVLSFFFIFIILGLLANVGYALTINMPSPDLAFFFARLSAFLLGIAMIFPLLFLIALLRSFKGITRNQLILYFLVWSLVFSGLFFIGKVYLDTDFVLRWDPWLIFYDLAIDLILLTFILVYSKRVYQSFQDPIVKHRFIYFIIGYLVIAWIMIAVILNKMNLITSIVSVGSAGIGMLIAPVLIYQGIGRKSNA